MLKDGAHAGHLQMTFPIALPVIGPGLRYHAFPVRHLAALG
jgi:hypothetical protein